jgi:hypothetical protein
MQAYPLIGAEPHEKCVHSLLDQPVVEGFEQIRLAQFICILVNALLKEIVVSPQAVVRFFVDKLNRERYVWPVVRVFLRRNEPPLIDCERQDILRGNCLFVLAEIESGVCRWITLGFPVFDPYILDLR